VECFFTDLLSQQWLVGPVLCAGVERGEHFLHGYWQRELDEMYPQMSDFEYLGRAYKELTAQVIEKIIDEKGELREGYTV